MRLPTLVLAAALLAGLTLPALAETGVPSTAEEIARALPLPGAAEVATPPVDANAVSAEIFGPRLPVDLAFGAFQRGYFLTALELALPRAERGDAAAQTLIAEIYAKGLGVAENLPRAVSWYALASKNGSAVATFELAMLYQRGQGVEKDRKKAAALFQRAADAGSAPAKYNLALLYLEGVYVEPSLTKAAALLKQAAEANMPEAQYDYGTLLIEGAGVAPNPVEAARHIQLAAEAGLSNAQVDLATMFYMGKGVTRDLASAIRWYKTAADNGNAVAQNRYAKLLAVGEGVSLDLEQAAMWRALARRQGLNDPTLDRLLVSIPKDSLARAEELARFWPSRPPNATASAAPVSEPLPTTPPVGVPEDATQQVETAPEPDETLDPKAPVPATRGEPGVQNP